jgi:hypothetical protein
LKSGRQKEAEIGVLEPLAKLDLLARMVPMKNVRESLSAKITMPPALAGGIMPSQND